MSVTNFTPGEWHICYLTKKVGVFDDAGHRIAKVSLSADATLMSAAPNLYAVLDAIQAALIDGTDARTILDENSPIRDAMREALVKAREEP